MEVQSVKNKLEILNTDFKVVDKRLQEAVKKVFFKKYFIILFKLKINILYLDNKNNN